MLAINFRHAALFADVLTGVSPTNTGCSPTRYSRGGHHQQSSALEFGEDDGVAQGRPAASSAVVSREKRAQDAQDGGAAASTSWTQGVCV